MNDEMISQFIDDELGLEEKIAFVNAVHEDRRVRDDAVSLLAQEALLRSPVCHLCAQCVNGRYLRLVYRLACLAAPSPGNERLLGNADHVAGRRAPFQLYPGRWPPCAGPDRTYSGTR